MVCADILKAVTPTLALVIILAVMPKLLKWMAVTIEKQPTKSAVDFSLGTKYYCFQFFIIFFFNTIIGAASSGKASGDDLPMVALYNELSDEPSKITAWLADAIPQQACFHQLVLFCPPASYKTVVCQGLHITHLCAPSFDSRSYPAL